MKSILTGQVVTCFNMPHKCLKPIFWYCWRAVTQLSTILPSLPYLFSFCPHGNQAASYSVLPRLSCLVPPNLLYVSHWNTYSYLKKITKNSDGANIFKWCVGVLSDAYSYRDHPSMSKFYITDKLDKLTVW